MPYLFIYHDVTSSKENLLFYFIYWYQKSIQKDVQTTIQEFIFKLSYKYNYIHILAVFSEIRLLSIQFKAMAANFERLPPIIPIYISPTLWFYELLK